MGTKVVIYFNLPVLVGNYFIFYTFIKNYVMAQAIDPIHQEWLVIIGKQVRKLRKEQTTMGYIEFAKQIGLDKKTYYKIERGEGDFNITNLMRVISYYPKLTLQEFFKETGL